MEARKVFVIEHCENSHASQWNTRIDDNLYLMHAQNLGDTIREHVPGAEIVFNKVPKQYAMSDIYCQLIANDDDNNAFYEIQPRLYAFEISFNGVLLFSKCLSKVWPHYTSLAKRCAGVAQAADSGQDVHVF
jgi:hypothetical protein